MIWLLIPLESTGQSADWKQNYLTISPHPGDRVQDLLQRYDLADYDCNVSEFCRLNNVTEKSKLNPDNTYKLPVCVAAYNGKSIRSTIGISDWKCATRINEYNQNARKEGLRMESFIDNKKLWVPFHEINCPDEAAQAKQPATKVALGAANAQALKKSAPITGARGELYLAKGTRDFSIFGSKYAHTPLIDHRLKNKVFYLISGHGGPDVGAQGQRAGVTLCEDEYAYDVTLRLLRLLLSHDATCYMIVRDPNDGIRDGVYLPCDKDEVVWQDAEIPLGQRERLLQRTDIINELMDSYLKSGVTDQTVIEIHVDSRSEETKTDVFFYFRPDSEPSEELAKKLHATFQQKYRNLRGDRGYTGTVTSRNLLTLKETSTLKAVYIELANIQNDWDQQRLVLRNNRQALANWLYQGLLK